MPSVTRRRALRACGTALVAGIAGCSAISGGGSGETPQLGRLTASNFHGEPHTVHAVLLDDEDPVYWQSQRLLAGESEDPSGATFDGYPTDSGEYVLHARVDDRPVSTADRLDFGEFDTGCLGVELHVGGFGSTESPELSIWKTSNPRECSEDAGDE